MPSPRPTLTRADVADHVEALVFGSDGAQTVGVELEWLTSFRDDRERRLQLDEAEAIVATAGVCPRGSRVTIEPGGQLEISTVVHADAAGASEAAATDLFHLEQICAQYGLELIALGADPLRDPARILSAPRYAAMQSHFDVRGRAGRTMMCNTASIQVNLGLGASEARTTQRWEVANALGPTLIASFANSPFADGAPSGWQSSRLRAWWSIDPTRTRPVPTTGGPVASWLDYALSASVMLIRADEQWFEPLDDGLSFAEWLESGHELGYPTLDDFEFHLTTLFPPVRPKGWFELRMVDALPTPFWHVAVAVTAAILNDEAASEAVLEATAESADLWVDAAQLGLGHPALARAAMDCFGIALEALEREGVDDGTLAITRHYVDRWTARGRSPADDRLDAWHADGSLFPRAETPIRYNLMRDDLTRDDLMLDDPIDDDPAEAYRR